jgi:hypothetical protein
MIKRVALVLVAAIALGLTPAERKAKLQKVREAVELGIQHGKNLQEAAEQARIETDNANKVAKLAVDSAMTSDTKAKLAEALEKRQHDQAVALAKWKKENEPIIKAVTGPWWFPGGRALLYGAKKSAISAIVIIVGGFVLFLIIKVVLTVVSGGTWSAGLGAVTGIFGAFGRWLGRAGKRLLSFFRRRGKTAVDNINHRTIGSEPDDN